MTNVLLLHGRVNIHPSQLGGLDDLQPESSGDGLFQQFLSASVTHPRTPSGHAARVDRQLVLEEFAAGEILPVRVLNPGLYDSVITQIERDRKSTRLNSSHVAISYAV